MRRSCYRIQMLCRICILFLLQNNNCHGFVAPTISSRRRRVHNYYDSDYTGLFGESTKEQADSNKKFGFLQRIESAKCLIIGAVAASVAGAPLLFLHDVWLQASSSSSSSLSQWEFDTDMAAVQGGLFAIVYRYCIREDENPQLNQGVIGAFVLTRTLGRITVPAACSALPLYCGAPLGYVDWDIIGQGIVNGAESAAIFGATAAAIDKAIAKGFLSKFPG